MRKRSDTMVSPTRPVIKRPLEDPQKIKILLCRICKENIERADTEKKLNIVESQQCSLCFGILDDPHAVDKLLERIKKEFDRDTYQTANFKLAIDPPTTMVLREIVMDGLLNGKFVPATMSPKNLFSRHILDKIALKLNIRASLNSTVVLTIEMGETEFEESDFEYFKTHFGNYFKKAKNRRKRSDSSEEDAEEGGGDPKPDFSRNDFKKLFSKSKIKMIETDMNEEKARRYNFQTSRDEIVMDVKFNRDPIYIAGRYCKYSRVVSQSTWVSDKKRGASGGIQPQYSVSELIGNYMKEFFNAKSHKFIASGREDVDVQMLGNGRPFAISLSDAHHLVNYNDEDARRVLKILESQLQMGVVTVNSLARVTQKQMQSLNEAQEEKQKTYFCICQTTVPLTEEMLQKLNDAAPFDIDQLTVVRAIVRRSLITRQRRIFELEAKPMDVPNRFSLKVRSEGGTYIKEFIHGDFGRTKPSAATLMGIQVGQVDILQLDVLKIDMAWPPKTDGTD